MQDRSLEFMTVILIWSCSAVVLQCYSAAVLSKCSMFFKSLLLYPWYLFFIIHRVVGNSHRRLTEILMHLTRSLEIPSPKTRIRMVWKYILINVSRCSLRLTCRWGCRRSHEMTLLSPRLMMRELSVSRYDDSDPPWHLQRWSLWGRDRPGINDRTN